MLKFEKEFTEHFKLTGFERIKIIKELFINKKFNKIILIHKLIIKKSTRINWERLFTHYYMQVNLSKRLLCWYKRTNLSKYKNENIIIKFEIRYMNSK